MDRSSSLEEVEFRRQETKDQRREHEDSSEDSTTVKVKNEGDINSMLVYLVERVKSLEKQVQQQSLPEDRSEISSEEDDNLSVNSKWLEFLPMDRNRWNSTKASDQAQGNLTRTLKGLDISGNEDNWPKFESYFQMLVECVE